MASLQQRNEEEDDGALQRQAFQDFMLSSSDGSGKKKKTSLSSSSPVMIHKFTSLPSPSRAKESSGKKARQQQNRKQRISSIRRLLDRTLCDWLQVDDQLEKVVDSIANLRKRCWVTSRSLLALAREQEEKEGIPFWKSHGYRSSSSSSVALLPSSRQRCGRGLMVEDLELTLSDELLQHEKMVALLRRLLSQLFQEQEAMGRRLNEAMMLLMTTWEYDAVGDGKQEEEVDPWILLSSHVEEYQQLYTATSRELFRKQTLAQQLFDSTNDSMLYYHQRDAEQDDSGHLLLSEGKRSHSNARRIAQKCVDRWPRNCKESQILEYSLFFERLVEKDGGGVHS